MSFSSQSRVWVYQADRPFSENEAAQLQAKLDRFCAEWTAHNHQLKAKAEIRYQHFIVLMVDESQASATGCSIDKSVHFLQAVEEEFGVKLFDRMLFAHKENGKVEVVSREQFEDLIHRGIIHAQSTVFNNLVTTKEDLDRNWEVPLEKSWHKSFFQVA